VYLTEAAGARRASHRGEVAATRRVRRPAHVSTYHGSSRAQVLLAVDRRGLISLLRISSASTEPTPASWADVDTILRAVAPQVHLLVADVSDGSCQPLHSIDPATPAPLGSAVKLYCPTRWVARWPPARSAGISC
jgi:hypothetical protein